MALYRVQKCDTHWVVKYDKQDRQGKAAFNEHEVIDDGRKQNM
jgi:hypothetical protein